jgi:hypothetical protein
MSRSYVPVRDGYRGRRARRTPTERLGLPGAGPVPRRGRPGRHRCRPGAGDGAGGVPLRDLPDADRGAACADGVVQPGTPRHPAAARLPRLALAGEVRPAVRDPRRHRLCRGHRRLRRPTPSVRLDRPPDPRRLPPPARARLGALDRDLARRPARGRPVRRGPGWAVRRRVDVPPRDRCVEGRVPGAGADARRRSRPARRHPVADPHLASLGVGEVSREEYLRRLLEVLPSPPAVFEPPGADVRTNQAGGTVADDVTEG